LFAFSSRVKYGDTAVRSRVEQNQLVGSNLELIFGIESLKCSQSAGFFEKGNTENLQKLAEAGLDAEAFTQDRHKEIEGDRDPDAFSSRSRSFVHPSILRQPRISNRGKQIAAITFLLYVGCEIRA
jgi:hypothetical protein